MGTEQIQFKQMTFEMAFYRAEVVDGEYRIKTFYFFSSVRLAMARKMKTDSR